MKNLVGQSKTEYPKTSSPFWQLFYKSIGYYYVHKNAFMVDLKVWHNHEYSDICNG